MNLPKPELSRESALNLWCTEHSEYAKEQMVLCNTGLIVTTLKRMGLNPLDEDLYSIGMIGLVKAIYSFDIDRGFAFSTCASRCIYTEIIRTFRKKRVVIAFSLDDKTNIGDGEEVTYSEMIADEKKFEEEVIANKIFSDFQESLSDREKSIIGLYLDGKTQDEISKILNISQSRVSKILKKCMQKYKSIFAD